MGSRRSSATIPGAPLLVLLATMIVALVGGASSARAATTYTATLQGTQEVPPNASTAIGSATVSLSTDQTTITVDLIFLGLSTPATAAHIHGPAAPGTIAPILFPLDLGASQGATSGQIPQQTFAITAAQVMQLQAGLFYVNVHDTTFPGGEIRGQLGSAVAVRVRSVAVARTSKGALVRWRTASEVDTLGFNVYRDVSGRRVRVNTKLIAASNAGGGRTYSFLDRRTAKGRAARYWIQVVNLDGSRQWFGPARLARA